jgi:DnaK suppressor protein
MDATRARLEQALAATVSRLRQIGGIDDLEDLPVGSGSIFEDVDRVQVEQSRDMGLMTRSRLVERARRLAAALGRIQAGTYGTCVECGEPIRPARLRALPEVETCVGCQAEIERAGRSPLAARA